MKSNLNKLLPTTLLLIFSLAVACRKEPKTDAAPAPSETKAQSSELYIGKTIYAGSELNDYEVSESDSLYAFQDSISYSVYKKIGGNHYVFSLEKLLSNEDMASYKILDTFPLTSFSKADLRFKANRSGKTNSLILFQNGKLVKKWNFALGPDRQCRDVTVEMGSGQECLFRNTTLAAAYRNMIAANETEDSDQLLPALPAASLNVPANKNGLVGIDYHIEKNHATVTLAYEGGNTEINFVQKGPDVKRSIYHFAD